MSSIAFFGAVELGLIYGIVAVGVFLTFRILDFPDLTVESTFPLGGAVAAVAILAGIDPWSALLLAFLAGSMAGLITAFLSVHCGILNLLAGILTMIAGFSINIRIMGRPNLSLLGEDSIFSFLDAFFMQSVLVAVLSFMVIILLSRFLHSEVGLALRATGQNRRMLLAQGGNPGAYVYYGLMLSNGLVALGGALFTQSNSFSDVTSGIGTIVYGLAAVILGETLFRTRRIFLLLLACLIGSVVYRAICRPYPRHWRFWPASL